MKKIKLFVLLALCLSLLILPKFNANAESLGEIYYPVGISDYVDLNNIKHFAVSENKLFYCKDDNVLICYDKQNKTSTTLSTTGEIYNISVEGEYVFVFCSNAITHIYKVDNLTSSQISRPPIGYNSIEVNYKDGKYYFAYIKNLQTSSVFKIDVYDNLANSPIKEFSYSENITTDYSDSLIAFSENIIALKPNQGNKIHFFNYPTEALTPIFNDTDDFFTIDDFSYSTNIHSMEIINGDGFNCVVISYGDNKYCKACEFNGVGLKFKNTEITFDGLTTFENILYGYSKVNANINYIDYNENTGLLVPRDDKFLAGKGSELGRFKDVTNLTYKAGELFVTDSGNNRIQNINAENIKEIETTGTCSDVVLDTLNNYYYATYSGASSKLYKNDAEIKTYSGEKIISIASNIDNKIYLLTLSGKILCYDDADFNLTLAFPVKSTSKLRINTPLDNYKETINSVSLKATFAVSVDNNVYSINKLNGEIANTLTFDSNVTDFKFNDACTNAPIFVLQKDGKFTKTTFTNNAPTTLEGFDSYSNFCINIISGEIYLYNSQISAIETYKNSEFSTPTTMLHYYQNINVNVGSENIWHYAEVKSQSNIFDYYYFTGEYNKVDINTKVIVLNANEEFAYIGYIQNEELCFGYVSTSDLVVKNEQTIQSMAINEEHTFKLRTTNKNVAVFKYPTIYNDNVIYRYAQGDIITTYGKYISNIDNNEYYIVKIGKSYGYVCSKDVVLNSNVSKSIRTNAKVKIFDGLEKINVYLENDEKSSIICTLTDGYKINVIDYDKNSKYTHITFIDEDQQEREGYILTAYVKMDGMSTSVITAIVLVCIDLVIAGIVVVFYCKYKKKQKKNAEEK